MNAMLTVCAASALMHQPALEVEFDWVFLPAQTQPSQYDGFHSSAP
jgi:hypothetical protein